MSDKTTIYISPAAADGLRRQALERGFTTRYGGEERASVSGLIEAIGLGKLKITKGDEMEKTIAMTAERLMALSDNGMDLYWTPGAQAPYWEARAKYATDVCVATVQDFVEAAGFDDLEGFDGNESFSLTVRRPGEPTEMIALSDLSDNAQEEAGRMAEAIEDQREIFARQRGRGLDARFFGAAPDDLP